MEGHKGSPLKQELWKGAQDSLSPGGRGVGGEGKISSSSSGPTAVGKRRRPSRSPSAWMARSSPPTTRLFYQGMDIGTAKPSPAERRRVPTT